MRGNYPTPPKGVHEESSVSAGNAVGQSQAVPQEPQRHSLHHCYIWLGTVRIAPIIYACGLSSLPGLIDLAELLGFASSFAVVGALLLLLAMTLVVCVVVLAVRAWAYRHTWYEFDETEFSFYSGIFNKRRTHVPYLKVQSVNERASLLQRLAGVCTVIVDTAGGASNKAVMVSYVERSAAEYLRRELFVRKRLATDAAGDGIQAGTNATLDAQVPPMAAENVFDSAADVMDDMRGIFAKEEVETGAITCEYGLSNKELFLAALCGKSSFALLLIAVATILVTVLSCAIGANLIDFQSIYRATGMGKVEFLISCTFTGFSVLGCLVAAWAVYLVSTCLSYGGFRARRRGSRIEVERGIVTHVFSGIDVERIQSVHIHQSFFQRLLHCCSVSYGRVGANGQEESSGSSSSQEAERLVAHPFLPLAQANAFIGALTPEYAAIPEAAVTPPKVALRRALTRRVVLQGAGFWLAVCLAALCGFAYWACADGSLSPVEFRGLALTALVPGVSLCLVVMGIDAIGAVLWFRNSAFGYSEVATVVVNGGYSTDTVVVPRKKMQYACTRANPLQRHARVATVLVRTAAGIHGKDERLIDVPVTDASSWLSWAEPRESKRV